MFASPLLTDREIANAICCACDRFEGGVYVHTALGDHVSTSLIKQTAGNSDTTVLRELAKRHSDCLARVSPAGAVLRSASDFHGSICVTDDEVLLLTSPSEMESPSGCCSEHCLVVRIPAVARESARAFVRIWDYFTTLETEPGERFFVKEPTPSSYRPWRQLIGTDSVRPVSMLKDIDSSLLDAALRLIKGASDRLVIATNSLIIDSSHPIGAAIANAVSRKVRVFALVHPSVDIPAQRESIDWLRNLSPNQVFVYEHRLTHANAMISDDQTALVWTGSVGNRLFSNAIEVGIMVDKSGVEPYVSEWIAELIERATHSVIQNATLRSNEPTSRYRDGATSMGPTTSSPRTEKGRNA